MSISRARRSRRVSLPSNTIGMSGTRAGAPAQRAVGAAQAPFSKRVGDGDTIDAGRHSSLRPHRACLAQRLIVRAHIVAATQRLHRLHRLAAADRSPCVFTAINTFIIDVSSDAD
jgi:hypothetical protein